LKTGNYKLLYTIGTTNSYYPQRIDYKVR